jgi:hypothetical protein
MSVHDGVLDIFLHTEGGVVCVGAPQPTIPQPMTYGRYTAAVRVDPVPGYKTAWLLWPDSERWPQDGEIDFPEGSLNGTISGYCHRQNGTSGGDQDAYETDVAYAGPWHVVTIEWKPNDLRFILDGVTIGHSTSRVPNTPMHWVLQTETDVDGAAPAASAQGHVQVDWVAVYTPA